MGKVATKEDYIIAIGASAGGLDDLYRFFENAPLDSVSYVVIQHLSPDFKSRMAELLSKHSVLEVKEAEDKAMLELNVVYFIPGDKFMTISDGMLHLTDKGNLKRPHNTVNVFFESLAKEKGDKSIAVILSGTGEDGKEGITDIKEAGGMIIATDPIHAEHSSMPANAIATGMVDHILIPELMPQVIVKYVKNRKAKQPLPEQDEEDEKIMAEILEIISTNFPLDFSEYKPTTILRRIKRRAATHNFGSPYDYLNFLKANPEEAETLSKDFLISVTSFFRDTEAFEYLETEIIPAIVGKAAAGEEIKAWVPGCATGEEAYSIAILIKEQLTAVDKNNINVKIFATDIDSPALAFAAKGSFGKQIEKQVNGERLGKYFVNEGANYKVQPVIRKMVIFSHHDVIKNPPYCNMDLISCRNLLIYLSALLQKKVLHSMHFGLKINGYLFLGSSENSFQLPDGLQLISKEYKVYQNLSEKKPLKFDATMPVLFDVRTMPGKILEQNVQQVKQSLAGSVNEAVMAELGYMVVCTDTKNQVLQTFGDTNKYLLQKNFVTNLTDLLPDTLGLAFKNASFEAIRTNNKVTVKRIAVEIAAHKMAVNLLIKPLLIKNDDRQILMSIFSEDVLSSEVINNDELFNVETFQSQYTINIEEELDEVKEKLIVSYEKLDAYKENIQSFNEELIAANEELQSANEEMQSVNEELYTINTAYLLKNKELLDLNDDLNNYFRSNVNGQLFVNRDLILMKYSPNTVKHVNLRETDIGRVINDISTNIKLDTLIEDIKQVIITEEVTTKESEATNGRWYQVMIMPYMRQQDGKTDGAIISFSDITELKRVQEELKILVDRRTEFMSIASHELKTPVTSLKGFVDIMKELAEEDNLPQYANFLAKAKEQITKLTHLIEDLLDVVKADSDQLQLEYNSFKLSAALEVCLENVNIHNFIKVTGAKDVVIYADKEKIEQVLSNIISNAIKYSTEKPEIIIDIKETDTFVIIAISDKGIGIHSEKLPFLFQRYYRVDRSNKKQKGLGLGLYISNQLIQMHKGKIEVISEVGKGSTFSIFLPKEKMQTFISNPLK